MVIRYGLFGRASCVVYLTSKAYWLRFLGYLFQEVERLNQREWETLQIINILIKIVNLKGGKQELNVLTDLMSSKLVEVTQATEKVGAAYKLNPITKDETLTKHLNHM